jgi:O-6-methylguanine DNA methyltransferase
MRRRAVTEAPYRTEFGVGLAVRDAEGAAMARNPFPPVIPCHRVVASDGSLAGYAGGLHMKASMLEMERDV